MSVSRSVPGGPQRTPAQNHRLDAAALLLIPALFTNVWYWQLIVPGLSSLKLGILTVILAAAAYAASRHRLALWSDPLRRPVLLMLCLGGLAFIGAPFAIVRGAAVDFLIYFFAPSVLLAVLVAARVRTESGLRFVIDVVLVGGVLYAGHFMLAPLDGWGKPFGTHYYDANDAAIMALVCLVLAIGRIGIARSWLAKGGFAALAMMYMGMVVRSGSRGAFLSLLVTIVLVLVTVRTVPLRWRIGSVAGGALLLLLFGSSSYWSLMSTMLEPEKDYNWAGNSESGRVEVWKRGFSYMLEDPLLGAGALNYANKEGRSEGARRAQAEGRGFKWSAAHNAYVHIGVELGFTGLVIFVSMLAIAARNLRRAASARAISGRLRTLLEFLLASIYAFAFASIFISSQYWTFLYVMIALATSGAIAARDAPRASATAADPKGQTSAGGRRFSGRAPVRPPLRTPAPLVR